MKQKLILTCTLLYGLIFYSQQDKRSFSMQEAINYALENNRTIKNADLNILAAEQQVWETSSLGLPQVNAALDYQTYLKTPFDTDNLEPGNILGFLFPKHQLQPSATLSQLIFDGGYLVGLQSNDVFLEISKNIREKTLNDVETNVVSSYNNALLTKESIDIMKNNISALQANLDETTKIYENGLTEEEDVEQLQLTLSSLENNLKNLESLYKISKGYLKILIGIPIEETIELTDSLENLVLESISLDYLNTEHSLVNNIDYKIAENDVVSKSLEYKLEKSEQFPKITAFVNASYLGFTNDGFSNLLNKEQEWLFSTLGGVSLNVPIFSSFGGKAKRQKAKIEWDMAKNDLITTKDQLELEYQNIKSEYTLAIDTYSNKQKNLALAEKIEKKNTIKYKEGITTSFDLRQAQLQLYTSQQEYLQSIIDVINKKAALKNLLNLKK